MENIFLDTCCSVMVMIQWYTLFFKNRYLFLYKMLWSNSIFGFRLLRAYKNHHKNFLGMYIYTLFVPRCRKIVFRIACQRQLLTSILVWIEPILRIWPPNVWSRHYICQYLSIFVRLYTFDLKWRESICNKFLVM